MQCSKVQFSANPIFTLRSQATLFAKLGGIKQLLGLTQFFKAFRTLFSAGHTLTLTCLPKMLECAAIFTTTHGINKSKVSLSVNVLTHGSPALGVSASPRASPWPGCQSSELCGLPPAHRAVELQAWHITLNC